VVLLFLAVSTAVINAGFLFNKSGTPFGEYEFKSKLLRHVKSDIKLLNHLPVPVPYPYLQGIDMIRYSQNKSCAPAYLLGQLAERNQGHKGYYFFAYLFKVPIAIQIFVIAALLNYIIRRDRFSFHSNESFLLIPVLIYFPYMNLFNVCNIGFRHVLWIMPLLFIFCGTLFKDKKWRDLELLQKLVTIFLIAYLAFSNLSYFPHYISYFNEIVLDRKMSYKYLADSNLDWGQNWYYWLDYKKKHPEAIINPLNSQMQIEGTFVVSANQLVGIYHNPDRYRWLRDNFEPVDHIAYNFLVFNFKKEDLEKLKYLHKE